MVEKNDGYPECVCKGCWINVKSFHDFYERVKWLHRNYVVKLVGAESSSCSDLIKQERCDSVREPSLEPDFNIDECEESSEETELLEQMIDMIKQEESLNYDDYNDDNSCNQGVDKQTSDDEIQPSNKNRKSDGLSDSNNTEDKTVSPDIKGETSREDDSEEFAQRKKDEEAAQMREFFTMKCDVCSDVEFATLYIAREHYRTVHNNKEGYLTCCGKRFFKRISIMDHIKHHLNPNAFPCDQCGKRFQNANGLRNHIASHTRSHKCSLCPKDYSKATDLVTHIQLKHSLEKQRKFHCEKCNKNYPTKYALKNHVRIVHELANALVCEICAHVCKSKPIYDNHVKTHSGTTKPKVQCDICGAWFKHKTGLRKHLKRHEDDFENCPTCNKKIQKHSLKDHIRNHRVVIRGHQCVLCDKAFRVSKLLKEHMAVHTGQDLYKCPYCERPFRSAANLYSHRKKAHFAEWTRDCAKSVAEKTSMMLL